MFCTACATVNPLPARACQSCGLGLRPRKAALAGVDEVPTTTRRRRVAPMLYGLPALVVLLVGWVAFRAVWAEPAAWYGRAAEAEAAGRLPEALDGYAAAAGHRDADVRRAAVAAVFAPHRAAYEAAIEASAAGRQDEAIGLLVPAVRALPGFEEAVQLLDDARRLRADDLRRRADDAEARRDWFAADHALSALLAVDPSDADLARRLAALQQAHAPLVLARDRALWLVGPNGADERLLTDAVPAAWPAWSPDRARVAFTSPEDGGGIALYVVAVDGTGLTRLADGLRPYAGPVWSPDGARIAYAVEGGWTVGANQIEPDRPGIRVVEIASGRIVDVTGGRIRDPLSPTWSPAGDRLAFVSREPEDRFGSESAPSAGAVLPSGEVYVATLATGQLASVSAGRLPHPWRVDWSPGDDRMLVYTRAPGMSYDRDRVRVVLLDAGSGAIADLPTGGERVTAPVWSPDGSRLAYVAGERTVVVRRLDDGAATRFEQDAVVSRFLAWSPDGGALLAVSENPGRPSSILNADDPAARPIFVQVDHDRDRRNAGAPQWSPSRPVALPSAPSLGGTALDHDPA